jgi:hypothetical protein
MRVFWLIGTTPLSDKTKRGDAPATSDEVVGASPAFCALIIE